MKKKIIIASSIFILLDQIIKLLVKSNLSYQLEYFIIPKFLYLTYTKNTGGAFSILENNPIILALIGIIFLVFLIKYLSKKKNISTLEYISYSILIGGIIGNFIDRIIYGYVIDYIGIIPFGYYYPIFNLADIGIVLGVIIMIYIEFRGEKHGISSK